MLRIIAGKYRHRIIEVPNVGTTRPTTDKVREAIMSSLGVNLIDSVVLDLFAGSGALGLEALSRGARKAYFCDNNFLSYQTIKNNITKLKIEEETIVYKCTYKKALENILSFNEKFDIIFLDPPYAFEKVYNEVIDYLIENDLLNEHAIVVKECNKELEYDQRFIIHKRYKYGTINVLIEKR